MAYRTDINNRDRSAALAVVVALHVGLVFALIHLGGKMALPGAESVIRMIELARPIPPPSPPPPPPKELKQQPKAKKPEGGSAPNIKSEATPIKAPKPIVEVPPVPQIATSETPRQGTAPTQGASNVVGPGTGTGGSGSGSGTGSGGGPGGGGGDNGVAQAPRLLTPVLRGRDIPRDLLDQWPGRATVFLRLKVDPRGYVTECTVDRGTGVAAIDATMCNIAHDRLRFRPALNRAGQPVAGWFGYAQPAPR